MDACDEFKEWNGQSEPTVRHQRGKAVPMATSAKVSDVIGKGLPYFGEFKKKREAAIAEHKKSADLLGPDNMPMTVRPPVNPVREMTSVQVRMNMISLSYSDPKFSINPYE